MTDQRSKTIPDMSCDQVTETAGLFVLHALDDAEYDAVAAHLATCKQPHEEFASLGSTVPALASLVEPVDAPPELKSRVLASVAKEAAENPRPAVTASKADARLSASIPGPRRAVDRTPVALPATRWRPPVWASWSAAVAAVLVLAVVGVWAIGVQSRADQANQRAQDLAAAIAALSEPDASVAILQGTGTAAGSSGFAAFPQDRDGYLVMVGLPAAPSGMTYQAWYLVNDAPSSAGLMTVGSDGYAILVGARPIAGTNLVVLTLEPAGGSASPTSAPIAAGEVRSGA